MFPIQNAVPCRYPPVVTWALIATNCAVFFFLLSLSPRELDWFLIHFALIPARYFTSLAFGSAEPALLDYLPFFTNMFLHAGWLHLILNMWTLWLFGPTIEDRLGPGRYLVFYLVCGVLASVTHAAFNSTSTVPALGASGAIAGVLGCYVRLFPFARVVVLIPILFLPLFFEVYAFVFVGLWIAIQVLQGTAELFAPSTGGGVAWWAHIGGFVAGLTFVTLLTRSKQRYRTHYGDEGILGFTPLGRR
jgi:membrane associated rhomboid family serine protease